MGSQGSPCFWDPGQLMALNPANFTERGRWWQGVGTGSHASTLGTGTFLERSSACLGPKSEQDAGLVTPQTWEK